MILTQNGLRYGMNKANLIRKTKEFIEDEIYKLQLSEFLKEDGE